MEDEWGRRAGLFNDWSREQKEEVYKAFLKALRLRVDRWIDSGKSEGSETPSDRTLSPVDRERIREFWDNNRVRVWVDEAGLLELRPEAGRQFSGGDVTARFRELIRLAEEIAVFCFSMLLDGDAPHRLMRCDSCSTYFARENAPRKGQPIKRGMYCQKCTQKGVNRRVTSSRDRERARRIELVAEFWLKYDEKKRRVDRIGWVVEEVNKSGKLPQGSERLKPDWLRRKKNIKAIEDRLEEIRRAN